MCKNSVNYCRWVLRACVTFCHLPSSFSQERLLQSCSTDRCTGYFSACLQQLDQTQAPEVPITHALHHQYRASLFLHITFASSFVLSLHTCTHTHPYSFLPARIHTLKHTHTHTQVLLSLAIGCLCHSTECLTEWQRLFSTHPQPSLLLLSHIHSNWEELVTTLPLSALHATLRRVEQWAGPQQRALCKVRDVAAVSFPH